MKRRFWMWLMSEGGREGAEVAGVVRSGMGREEQGWEDIF